jgi:hypothetical protein
MKWQLRIQTQICVIASNGTYLGLYYIKLCFISFVLRNCDAEFSQIFTGTIFHRLSSEEKLLFSSFYVVRGVCLQCNKNNERNSDIVVSYISEIELANCDDLVNGCPDVLSPNNINDTKIQCTDCESLINGSLTSFQPSTFRFVEFEFSITNVCSFQNELFIQGHKYVLKALVRHAGAHSSCAKTENEKKAKLFPTITAAIIVARRMFSNHVS